MVTDSSCDNKKPYSYHYLFRHLTTAFWQIQLVPNHTQMAKGVKIEGTSERKRGRKEVKARHQWTELPEWWIRSVYMCRPVLVRASLGETWEASCLCRSAKQKEPLTIHPHISYLSFVPFVWFCLFFDILNSTKLLTPSTAFFGLTINMEGNGHKVLMLYTFPFIQNWSFSALRNTPLCK